MGENEGLRLDDAERVAAYEACLAYTCCLLCGACSEGPVSLCGCPVEPPSSGPTLTVTAIDRDRGVITFG